METRAFSNGGSDMDDDDVTIVADRDFRVAARRTVAWGSGAYVASPEDSGVGGPGAGAVSPERACPITKASPVSPEAAAAQPISSPVNPLPPLESLRESTTPARG